MDGFCNMILSGFLPDDIVVDILSRLPSKSLLRFRSVCKSWYFFISDPNFIKLHSNRSSQNPKFLFLTYGPQFHLLEHESSSFDESCLSAPFRFPVENNVQIVFGSSCGLVCVASGHLERYGYCFGRQCGRNNCGSGLFVWNPFTGEFRLIPDLTSSVINQSTDLCYACGFGYDPVSNDLKLVVSEFGTTFNVFSMKSNSWKSIAFPYNPSTDFRKSKATVLEGVFYWFRSSDVGDSLEIVAFDSRQDEFSKLHTPLLDSRPYDVSLLEPKGCLCIAFSFRKPKNVMEIWMWKEHVWIHSLSISTEHIFRFGEWGVSPFCISRSGTQVILQNGTHILRSTRDDKFEAIETFIFEAFMCVETLVSPNHIICIQETDNPISNLDRVPIFCNKLRNC